LRSIDDVGAALRAGADKVAINTAAIRDPKLISKVANKYGSQCMILSIQAKWNGSYWEAYFDNGREHSGINAVEWAIEGESLGAGEIIVTSVDREGTKAGFDCELISRIASEVPIPVIASGGMGKLSDFSKVVSEGKADAVAIASVLHYDLHTLSEIRSFASESGIPVRSI